jgi:hypothetical protein
MKTLAVLLAVLFVLQAAATGGIETTDGGDVNLWKTHTVIYGRIASVVGVNSEECVLEIIPYATFAGIFDATSRRIIKAKMYIGEAAVISDPPSTNSNVVLVLRKDDERYTVAPYLIGFMPEGKALQTVQDLADPMVSNIIDALRRAREKVSAESADKNREGVSQ